MRSSYLAIVLALTLQVNAQCDNDLFVNGSFTSIEGVGIAAPGWTGYLSPDINDELGPLNTSTGYVWTGGTPIASPSGGTWQNLFHLELVSQTVQLSNGYDYTLCFEYTAQGIYLDANLNFSDPVGIDVLIDGVTVHTSPIDTTLYTWENSCFDFTATADSSIIQFRPTNQAYVALDGACLQLSSTGLDNMLYTRSDLTISPNPFVDHTLISFNDPSHGPYRFVLFDSRGIVAHTTKEIRSNEFVLQRNGLEEGIYFFQLLNDKGKMTHRGKLIIE